MYQYVLYHYISICIYHYITIYHYGCIYIYTMYCIVAYPCISMCAFDTYHVHIRKNTCLERQRSLSPTDSDGSRLHFSREPSSLTPRYCTKPWFLLERKKNGSDMFHVHNQHFQKSLEKKELVTNARQLLHDCSADSARFHPPSLYMSLTDRYSHAYIYIVYIFICAYMYIANSGAVRCTQRSMCSTT